MNFEETEVLYNVYRGILRNNRSFQPGKSTAVEYRMDCPEYADLLKKYPFEKIAGKGTDLQRAIRVLKYLSPKLTHSPWYDGHVDCNALALLDYSLDKPEQGINCLNKAKILEEICLALGIYARRVRFLPYSPFDFDCHVVTEIYDRSQEKWYMLDPTTNGYLVDEQGTILSLLEARERMADTRFVTYCKATSREKNLQKLYRKNIATTAYYAKNLFRIQVDAVSQFGESGNWLNFPPEHFSIREWSVASAEYRLEMVPAYAKGYADFDEAIWHQLATKKNMQTNVKKTFFISDAHLGSWAIADNRQQELRLVHFLDSIKDEASAIYMLGDMFDFWHEYRYAVPKGFTRFLGKLSELTDKGIDIHFITGNHDLWMKDYLHNECGVTIHQEKIIKLSLSDKCFYLSHGDALNRKDYSYLVLRFIFRNKICQKLFASLHPRWGLKWGYLWARHSRRKHIKNEGFYIPEDKDNTLAFVRQFAQQHPDTSNRPDIIEIGIEAKLAFGTGNHETTRMIISQLLQMPIKTKRVLDCGTGTGILGLTASKLGAKEVVGYDIDEWSVENAKHNALLNGVDNMEVLFGNSSVLNHISGVFDVVMANINRNILLDDMRLFRSVMNTDATLILSGFYEEDVPVLLEKANELGLHETARHTDNNWTCLVLKVRS